MNAFINYINEDADTEELDNMKSDNQDNSNCHKTSRTINLRTRFIVFQRDNFKCCACGASEKYIEDRPEYIFAGIYTDEGISGTDLKKRDAFNRMLQDARAGGIDMIITKSLSRFGRNTLDCLKCLRELKSLNVDVFFEKEQIHSLTSQGEVLISLISAVAQTESLALSENIKWGIRRKYERGLIKSIPSGKFLGYDKDQDGNLVINEAQAAIVRRIYQEFLVGYGTFQIAKRLTAEKVPTAYGGKEWCASHIKKVLTNEKIKGDTRFQKTYNADYLTKKRVKNRGELPSIIFKVHIPES